MKISRKTHFEALYRDYRPMVKQLCLGFVRGNQAVADDLTQEVFINCWKALPGFRAEASPKTWIHKITVNTCLQYVRKRKSRENLSIHPIPEEEPAQGHDELYRAIGRLAKIDRLVVMLFLEEMSQREIAEIMGLRENNIRVRLHRIKKRLKKLVEDEQRVG